MNKVAVSVTSVMQQAKSFGADKGKARASWVFDGNTDVAEYQRIWDGWETTDPEVMDMCPAPLSGEFADEPIPSILLEEWGVGPDHALADDFLNAYEDSFNDAFWQEVLRACAIQLDFPECSICKEYGHKAQQHIEDEV